MLLNTVVFSHDGASILSESDSGMNSTTVRLWDTKTGEELLELQVSGSMEAKPIRFSADDKRFTCCLSYQEYSKGEEVEEVTWDIATRSVVDRTRFDGFPLDNEDPSRQQLRRYVLKSNGCIEAVTPGNTPESLTICYLPSSFNIEVVRLYGHVCVLGLGSEEVVILHLPH
jgi:WD40 repeat protein